MTKFQYDSKNSAEEEYISRSQKKRDSTALQKQGEEYLNMNEKQWEELELSEEVKGLLREYKTLKTHEARRRHLQYLGKILRKDE